MERIALVRLQSDTMFSGLQFSLLIRAGFAICLELSTFLRSCVRSRSALLAENLFLRKQLAFYQEHQLRPRRLTDAARISLVLWSKFCDWRSESHLRSLLKQWVAHYNQSRPHSSLGPGIPEPSNLLPPLPSSGRHTLPEGSRVVARPVLGGLHHEYRLEKVAA